MEKDIFEEYETNLLQAEVNRAIAAQPRNLTAADSVGELASIFADEPVPAKTFGHLPQPYDEDTHKAMVIAEGTRTQTKRNKAQEDEQGDPVDAMTAFEMSDLGYFGDMNSPDNPDSLLDGDTQAYMDMNY